MSEHTSPPAQFHPESRHTGGYSREQSTLEDDEERAFRHLVESIASVQRNINKANQGLRGDIGSLLRKKTELEAQLKGEFTGYARAVKGSSEWKKRFTWWKRANYYATNGRWEGVPDVAPAPRVSAR